MTPTRTAIARLRELIQMRDQSYGMDVFAKHALMDKVPVLLDALEIALLSLAWYQDFEYDSRTHGDHQLQFAAENALAKIDALPWGKP